MAARDESFKLLIADGYLDEFLDNHLTNHNLLVLETLNEEKGYDYLYIWLSICGNIMTHSAWGDAITMDSLICDANYRTCSIGSGHEDDYIHELFHENLKHYHVVHEFDWNDRLGEYLKHCLNLDSDFFRSETDSVKGELDLECISDRASGNKVLYYSQVKQPKLDPNTGVEPQISEEKVDKMTTEVKEVSKISRIAGRVKTSGVTALQYQAGKALNAAVITAAKKAVPMYVRGYLDHPAAPVVLAIALAIGSEFIPEGENKDKVVKATDLMLNAAAMDGSDKFLNVDKLIASVFEKLPKEVLSQLEAPALEAPSE